MTVHTSASNEWNCACWSRLAWVLAGVLLATLIRFPVQSVIRDVSPFLFYLPVVVAVAIAFGQRFGLLATILSVLPANYFWMPPDNAFELNLSDAIHVLGFSIAGLSVSWLSEAGRKRKRLEEHLRATLAGVGDAIVTTDCCGRIVYLNSMAEVLTELDGPESVGCMLGSALTLVADDGRRPLNGIFQMAINNDDLESLPRRLIVCSKTGRQYRVEQRASRIVDPSGRKLGIAILFHQPEPPPDRLIATSGEGPEDLLNAGSRLPRIAMICTPEQFAARPSETDFSGTALYVLEISRKIAQLGYEVDIWTRQIGVQPGIESVGRQVRIIRIAGGEPNIVSPGGSADGASEWNENALQFVRKHRLEYEWINSHGRAAGQAGQFLSRNLGVSHLHTPHSVSADEKSVTAAADLIVATCPQEREILARSHDREKCLLVPYGYDETRFYPAGDSARKTIRKRLGFRSPVVHAVGRLTDCEGCELLVRAFAGVSQQMPEAMLHLTLGAKVLTPDETSVFLRLRALIGELGLTRKVIFLSCLPDEQRADYYRAADVLVLSSTDDSGATTALEAIACGTPTVLANDSNGCQWVDSGANGFDPGLNAAEKLGLKILKILQDPPLRRKLSLRGARLARSRFTWTGITQELVAVAGCKGAAAEAREQWSCAD